MIDPDPEARALLERTVRGLGHRVCSAATPAEALQWVLDDPPDAVVLDSTVRNGGELEVCRCLRSRPVTAGIPVIVVAAGCDLPQRLAGFEAGANDYITKPFDPAELGARLQAQIEHSALLRQLAELNGVLATLRLISHEFNNPLMSVVGGLDLLRMSREDAAVDEGEALSMIEHGAEQLRKLAQRVVQITEPSFKDSPIGPMLDIEMSR